ncbi:MAG TPA: sodium ABC transporter ATP-binding protein, partial [Anaerolineales bacterium]|nr:sodium ABC transporter ATP-binding protein [Anaerolineales bacterium]
DGILRKVAQQGRTILMTSHDLARAADLASRFEVLSRGRIAASAPRSSLVGTGLLDFYRDALHQGAGVE